MGPHNHSAGRIICPHCRTRVDAQRWRVKLLVALSAVIVVPIGALFGAQSTLTWHAAGFGWFYLMLHASLFPHELGHALVARWVRCPPIAILIGAAPWSMKAKVLGSRWLIGQGAGNACTLIAPGGTSFLRWRLLLLTLAGPLASGAIAAGAFTVARALPESLQNSTIQAALFIAAAANGFVAFANLWPHRVTSPMGPLSSDGAQIWRYLTQRLADPQQIFHGANAMRAWLAYQDNDFTLALREVDAAGDSLGSQPEFVILKSAILCGLERPAEAKKILSEASQAQNLHPQVRAMLANNLAWTNFMLDDPALLDESLALSEQAFGVLPWMPPIVVTRACTLAAAATGTNLLGDEVRKILERARDLNLEPRSQACAAIALGLAEIAAGNDKEARECLARAQMLGAGLLPILVLEKRLTTVSQ